MGLNSGGQDTHERSERNQDSNRAPATPMVATDQSSVIRYGVPQTKRIEVAKLVQQLHMASPEPPNRVSVLEVVRELKRRLRSWPRFWSCYGLAPIKSVNFSL